MNKFYIGCKHCNAHRRWEADWPGPEKEPIQKRLCGFCGHTGYAPALLVSSQAIERLRAIAKKIVDESAPCEDSCLTYVQNQNMDELDSAMDHLMKELLQ